ncbi:MAG: hypothetical protein MJ188_01480 [Treponema sp.]|nr:hypothetical protein [Treponema sp.]
MATFVSFSQEYFIPSEDDILEAARYLGYRKSDIPEKEVASLIKLCCKEMRSVIAPQAVFEQFDLFVEDFDGENKKPCLSFADVKLNSKDLFNNLRDCCSVYLLAATIGPRVDALIRKTQSLDSAKASVFQAVGAMYIEKVVDFANQEIKKQNLEQGKLTRPRFSPGYGDVSLQVQKDFFRLLPCTRIGLTLMDSLIMAPEKSVTAFVGAYKSSGRAEKKS